MRSTRFAAWRKVFVVAGVLILSVSGTTAAQAAEDPLAPVSDTLSGLLGAVAGGERATVLVHGSDSAGVAEVREAVHDAGLTPLADFRRIGVVAATGTVDQVRAVRAAEGVGYVENNDALRTFASSGTTATRSALARQTLTGANGTNLDGSGVGVAVIDTGVDATHPALRGKDGTSRVVSSHKSLCVLGADAGTGCILPLPPSLDSDTISVGGHGTHVAGIAAGNDLTLTGGTHVGGSAPGAKITSISTGAATLVLGADAALNWVLENHDAPCGEGVPRAQCPPIKVVNNSYGPSGGGAFDPNSATVKLQRALAAEGVVTVWANGNDGGDGSANLSNPPGQDPTPGVLSVASYNDRGTGTRDGAVSSFSSRGKASDMRSWPDISAPGENILSSCRPYLVICSTGGKPQSGPGPLDLATYNVLSGTSMAAPQITGIVAQLFQAAPDATPARVEDALKSTAHKFAAGAPYRQAGAYTSSFDKGTGLVDTVAAARKLGAR